MAGNKSFPAKALTANSETGSLSQMALPIKGFPRDLTISAARQGRLLRLRGLGPRAYVHPLALLSKQADELDGSAVSAGEPVRGVGVEFRGLARAKFKVLVAQHQTQSSVEDVEPFVAFVNAGVGLCPAGITGEHHLEGLQSTWPSREGNSRHASMGNGPEMNSRIPGGRGADQIIEGDTVQPREGQQDFEVWPALAGFKAGQGANRYSGCGGHISEGEVPFRPECPKPGADCPENVVKLICHSPSLP